MSTQTQAITTINLADTWATIQPVSAGRRVVTLDTADNNVLAYLPPNGTGGELVVFNGSASNTAYLQAFSRATIGGSSTQLVTLANIGDCIELYDDGATWQTLNPLTVIR